MIAKHGYVITGGPGSGKTSLINALANAGYTVFEEVSRRLIQEQQQLPNGVLPWHNLQSFATMALVAMQQQFATAQHSQHPVFFDRAIPDIMGYLDCAGLPHSPALTTAAQTLRYASPVFICPPWPDIYVNDPERPQTYTEAANLYLAIHQAYTQAGYTLLEVPQTSLANRVRFITDTLTAGTTNVYVTHHSIS